MIGYHESLEVVTSFCSPVRVKIGSTLGSATYAWNEGGVGHSEVCPYRRGRAGAVAPYRAYEAAASSTASRSVAKGAAGGKKYSDTAVFN
jgi:hypothetical protein